MRENLIVVKIEKSQSKIKYRIRKKSDENILAWLQSSTGTKAGNTNYLKAKENIMV